MNIDVLTRQFEAMGARLAVDVAAPAGARFDRMRSRLGPGQDFTLDVRGRGKAETFALMVREDAAETLDLTAVDVQPKRRHLLLLAKPASGSVTTGGEGKRKFLCGHDERHWFVASVPQSAGVASITDAMEALKPAAARAAQFRSGVRPKDWHRRMNAGFIRQGEWFFLPLPDFPEPRAEMVLRHEPVQRSGAKPHVVECLFREGGTTVYVNAQRYPGGLTQREYEALLARQPEARAWPWNVMKRNPEVYAKGKIRHPDHATIELPFWHRVVLSREQPVGLQRTGNVAFLD